MSTGLLAEFKANEQGARELVLRCTHTQLNWRSSGGAWSIAECIEHLALANSAVGGAIAAAQADPRQQSRLALPRWLGRFLVRWLEPPYRVRSRTTASLTPQAEERDQEVLEHYMASHNILLAPLRQTPPPDLERVRFRHPAVPLLLTVATGLELMAAHERRHLWQADHIARLPDYPR